MAPLRDGLREPRAIREACRSGAFAGQTAGLAPGCVQTNLMILPREAAAEFLAFCERNPVPCPLVEVLPAGETEARCAPGSDLRTDLPGYRIFRDGRLEREADDILDVWREDLVSFLIGCSFSFEEALVEEGIALRHLMEGRNVAMFDTSIACRPAGRFRGNMVVSMRPIRHDRVERVCAICRQFPRVHGEPVHVGDPAQIGIRDLARPDYGDAVAIADGEVPVFWGCGVTPQAVALASGLPFCITHAPGRMFVTDLANESLRGKPA